MHSFLITGFDSSKKEQEIEKIVNKFSVKRLEFKLSKIADVKELTKLVNFAFPEKTAVIVKGLDTASEESQNAFLKTLEEPQENIIFILSVVSSYKLLPTIVSRCRVINVVTKPTLNSKEISLIDDFLKARVGKRLILISKIRKKDEAITFLTTFIFRTHALFLAQEGSLDLAKILKKAQKTLSAIQANGNVSLHLTSFAILTPSLF